MNSVIFFPPHLYLNNWMLSYDLKCHVELIQLFSSRINHKDACTHKHICMYAQPKTYLFHNLIISLSGIYPKKIKLPQRNICFPMFTVTLFTLFKPIPHTLDYHSALKKEILSFLTTWMNLGEPGDIMLNEIIQAQKKNILDDCHWIWKKVKITEAEEMVVIRGGEEMGMFVKGNKVSVIRKWVNF